jgi:hypothetical protein
MINTWTRTDNLPYFLDDLFSHIREESECLGEVDLIEVEHFIHESLKKEFPKLFNDLDYNSTVYIEYDLFELGYFEDEKKFPGYAVYIYFHETIVKKLIKNIMVEYPEYLLKVI